MEKTVPSSISSSNQRIPSAPYGKLWGLVLLLVLLFGGLVELFLRHEGYMKSNTDDKVLWGMEFDKVRRNDVDVAVVGASRVQLGLQVDHFEERSGCSVANISINGGNATPVLKYIAEKTDFSGYVIVSTYAEHIMNPSFPPKTEQWLSWYDHIFLTGGRVNLIFNKTLLNFFQSKVVFFSSNVSLIPKKHLNYLRVMPSRSIRAYYRERLTEDEQRQLRERWGDPDEGLKAGEEMVEAWRLNCSELRKLVSLIQKRGGRVIFIRFPTTGLCGSLFDMKYPREQYWDSLSDLTGATTIHFKDIPSLVSMVCPDGSHLNYDDSLIMTDELVEQLGRLGLK
jgi:hypothetical protein